jgi:methionine-rich copper-binding protein CopC
VKTLAGLVAAVTVAGLMMIGLAPVAAAHNSLIGSDPKDGATLESGPARIELKFDQPVQAGAGLNTITVIGPSDDRWEGGTAEVASNVVTAPLRPLGPAGVYKIGYRILSADGHPVSGELKFTLTKAGNGTPAAAGSGQAQGTTPSTQDTSDGLPAWVWIVGAGVLLAAGLVLASRIGGKGLQ